MKLKKLTSPLAMLALMSTALVPLSAITSTHAYAYAYDDLYSEFAEEGDENDGNDQGDEGELPLEEYNDEEDSYDGQIEEFDNDGGDEPSYSSDDEDGQYGEDSDYPSEDDNSDNANDDQSDESSEGQNDEFDAKIKKAASGLGMGLFNQGIGQFGDLLGGLTKKSKKSSKHTTEIVPSQDYDNGPSNVYEDYMPEQEDNFETQAEDAEIQEEPILAEEYYGEGDEDLNDHDDGQVQQAQPKKHHDAALDQKAHQEIEAFEVKRASLDLRGQRREISALLRVLKNDLKTAQRENDGAQVSSLQKQINHYAAEARELNEPAATAAQPKKHHDAALDQKAHQEIEAFEVKRASLDLRGQRREISSLLRVLKNDLKTAQRENDGAQVSSLQKQINHYAAEARELNEPAATAAQPKASKVAAKAAKEEAPPAKEKLKGKKNSKTKEAAPKEKSTPQKKTGVKGKMHAIKEKLKGKKSSKAKEAAPKEKSTSQKKTGVKGKMHTIKEKLKGKKSSKAKEAAPKEKSASQKKAGVKGKMHAIKEKLKKKLPAKKSAVKKKPLPTKA